MKYIKGQITVMRDQGYQADSSEIIRLKEALEELAREQAKIQTGQGETMSGGEGAAVEGTELSMDVLEGGLESPVEVGGMVDISL